MECEREGIYDGRNEGESEVSARRMEVLSFELGSKEKEKQREQFEESS